MSSEPGATRGPEDLLATKLYLPRAAPGLLARPELTERLDAAFAARLTLVCAPPGFGKTSLLADWSRQHDTRLAWLSLDASDSDPIRFWRYVVAAVGGVKADVAARVAPLLSAPSAGSLESVVTQLINEIAAESADLLLVLDDYHLIETHTVHDSLSFLIDHAPPTLHIVLATRADPPLALARLRARGELTELRAADLRFTAPEAEGLLRQVGGPDLSSDVIAALTARTEGWAAGLQLAALSLESEPDAVAFVESFSGSNRYVLDYLTEEVLERQPPPVREFLLETSLLERVSGPLCDAVTGRAESQAMLEAIERANLFLVPLDEERKWWRLHQLFADLLRNRLRAERPGRLLELHRKAAEWHEEHGLVDSAVSHWMAAGDLSRVASLIERHAEGLLLRGEVTTVDRWLGVLPPDFIRTRPRLLLLQTRFVLLEEVEELVDAAELALADTADEPFEPSVGSSVSRLGNVPAMIAVARAFVAFLRGDGDATMAFALDALEQLADGEWMLDALAHANLGSAEWLSGQLPDAERDLQSSIARWQMLGAHEMVALWCLYLGKIEIAQGRLDRALTTQQAILERAADDQAVSSSAGAAHVGMACVLYQRNELDEALEHVIEGLELCRRFVTPDAEASGLATLAWIKRARGDVSGAFEAMEEATRVADPAMAELLNPIPAEHARLLLAAGDVEAAARWAFERGLDTNEVVYAREPAYLALARVLMTQGETGHALSLLDKLHVAAAAQHRRGIVIEIQTLRALTLMADGDESAALDALTEALSLGEDQSYVRLFVDEGPPLAALLGTFLAARRDDDALVPRVSPEYVGRLVRAFDRDASAIDGATSAVAVPGLVTQLSERELEVLQLLVVGLPNQQIADELFLALNTVKKHVTHIFDKLGVNNRTEAATRAREFGLVA